MSLILTHANAKIYDADLAGSYLADDAGDDVDDDANY